MLHEINYNEIQNVLARHNNIVIVSHANPDGDAIGSSLALYHLLSRLPKKKVHVVIPDPFPRFLGWLPGSDDIHNALKEKDVCLSLIEQAEIIFCLDMSAADRLRVLGKPVREAQAYKIMVDHHINPEKFCDQVLSDTNTSSTAELLYTFMHHLNMGHLVDKKVAECLFVGIMTDTGSFSYSADRAETYRITAQLIEAGVNSREVHNRVYDTFSENRLRLLGHCLNEGLTVMPEYHTAFIALTIKDMNRYAYRKGDTEGIVNYPLSIDNIYLAAFFTERKDMVKVSFRSKGSFSVNRLARNFFNGGGHLNAAGGYIYLPFDEAVQKFVSVLPSLQEELVKSIKR